MNERTGHPRFLVWVFFRSNTCSNFVSVFDHQKPFNLIQLRSARRPSCARKRSLQSRHTPKVYFQLASSAHRGSNRLFPLTFKGSEFSFYFMLIEFALHFFSRQMKNEFTLLLLRGWLKGLRLHNFVIQSIFRIKVPVNLSLNILCFVSLFTHVNQYTNICI